MSVTGHEQEAAAHADAAAQHAAQYDPQATAARERCQTRVSGAASAAIASGDICWTSVTNPTETHLRQAEEHLRHAADHRAASAALRDAEARACVGINPEDRDVSPFEHAEDIAGVAPLAEHSSTDRSPSQRMVGAVVTFRAVPGMTAEWLQRVVDCHLARNASMGNELPGMPNCPLALRGAQARVSTAGNGFSVAIRSDDPATAGEILSRAERLRPAPTTSAR